MNNLEHSLTEVKINNPLLICKYGDNNDVFNKQDWCCNELILMSQCMNVKYEDVLGFDDIVFLKKETVQDE